LGTALRTARWPFSVSSQAEFAAIIGFVLDPLDRSRVMQQRGHRAADRGFVRAGAMRDVLRAARIAAEAECRDDAPGRNIEAIARLILARERGTDLRREPVEAERHEV
jgi:hypothetical protein